jgi:acetylornithine deacetylase/succinyl-diaminopimelate desuccinylase-like protein
MPTFDNPLDARLADYLAAHQHALIDFCRRLIQTPSVNGEHDEVHLAEVIAAEARALGLDAMLLGEFEQRPNVIVSTSDGKPGLLLLGHLDTVPTGDPSGWSYPPYSGGLVDGRIYGRGAIDTKGGMAASIYALAALKAVAPEVCAQFIGVPDEETGATGTLGVKYLAARNLLRGKGAIYAYSGSEIVLGHRGLLRYRLFCTGEAIHTGAFEWQERTAGANAVMGMARLLVTLEGRTYFPYSSVPYFDRFKTVVTAGTVVSGGVSINIVPDRCEALIDIRTTPEHDARTIEALIEQCIAEVLQGNRALQFGFERLNYIPAAISDERAPLFDILSDVIPQVRGVPAVKTVAGPANEGYLLIEQGIPTVCGMGVIGANAHAPDEYVEVAGLLDAALIFAITGRRMG